MNKPAINSRFDSNMSNYFAFSPTNRKSLSHSNLFKTVESQNDKFKNLLQSNNYTQNISKATNEKSRYLYFDSERNKGNVSNRFNSRISNLIL